MSATFIPLCVPEIGGNEWAYVKECLDTGWVSSVGAYVERFEAGVEPNDEVLVSTLTFIAPANAIRYAGAWPVFIDADPAHWQMDVARAIEFLDDGCVWREGALYNRTTGRRVRAVLPVHILGHPVDMAPLLVAARKYELAVIEDATESLGARYRGASVGHLGDIACFSFNGNKLLTTGGGGALVTDNEAWARRARHLTTQATADPIEYVHHELGFNYRLTNLQAAMGVAQLERLDAFVQRKRIIAARYATALDGVPGLVPMPEAAWAQSSWWMYTIVVRESEYGRTSRELLKALETDAVQTRPLWQPLHCSLAHRDGFHLPCPVAEALNRDALSLPCSVGLSIDQQQRVIDRVVAHAGAGCA